MVDIADASVTRPALSAKLVATVGAGAAALCSVFTLLGWVLESPGLTSFGILGSPIFPLTALGFLALAIGLIAAMHGRIRVAGLAGSIPLLIAANTVIQMLAGRSFGTDRLLFGDQLLRLARSPLPGRVGIISTLVFVVLLVAGGLALYRGGRLRAIAMLTSSLALWLGLLGTVLILFSTSRDPMFRVLASSLPGDLCMIFLGAAFIAWTGNFAWVRTLATNPREWRVIRLLFLAAVLLPILPSMLDLWISDSALLSPVASALLEVLINMMAISLLCYWAVSRLARDQIELGKINQALESASVAITTLDGTIVHWSQGCTELYGWSAAEAIGQNKYLLLKSRCEQRWRGTPPSRAGHDSHEMIEIRKDGSEVAVLERTHRVTMPNGERLLVLNMTDITRGAQAMAALRNTEERLGLAVTAHQLGAFEWDVPSGRFEWSPGAEQRLGLTPGSMPDFEHWRELVEPDDVQTILDTIARAVAERADRYTFRFRFRNPNGSVRAVEGSSRTFYDARGNLVRTVGVILDTTAREEREAALRSREAQLRSILETVPDAMLVMDETGRIREFSIAAEALWGYRSGDVVGQDFALLAPESDRSRYRATLEAFQADARPPYAFIGRVVTGVGEAADGRRFPVDIRVGIARTDEGPLFTVFFRDLSEQLANEERLGDLNAELAHVSRQNAMSELAADLAHELNQPLSASSNFLAAARMLLEEGRDTERAVELVRMAGDQTIRAGEIIRRLRAFTARGEVDTRAESIEQTIRDAADLVMLGTRHFDIQLRYELDPHVTTMFADRVQVQQVLVNLLRNATDALRTRAQTDRQIFIATRSAPDNMVLIEVCDNGPGLSEATLKQLYTRFVTSKGEGGMGIGLSISRRIVEAHGGTLTAENRTAGGACFRFTLPAMQEEIA